MDFKNIVELKDISVKHFIDFFKCNKGIAKELMKILKDYRENKIFYNFVETNCCCIKLYIFDKGDMFKVYKIEYLEKDKKINKLYEYNLQNNSIVKEKIKDKNDEKINEYSIDGKLLLKFYNSGQKIEFYTWKENEYVLEKIEHCENGKMSDCEIVSKIDECGNFLSVLKDKYTHMDKKTRMINIKEILRPDIDLFK